MEIQHIALKQTESTNTYAKKYLNEHKNANLVLISTECQSEGRGQFSNTWDSECGKNITISLIIKPQQIKASDQFILSQLVALGIVDMLSSYIKNVKIKWPNDIYCDDEKICGVLIENTLMGETILNTIIGIGLNVNQTEFSQLIPNPTSMSLKTGDTFNLDKTMILLVERIIDRINRFELSESLKVKREYLKNLFLYSETALFTSDDGEFFGEIKDVSGYGKLSVQRNGNIQDYNLNEIKLVLPVQRK